MSAGATLSRRAISDLDAVLVGGIWDGKTFRVPEPPPPRIEVALSLRPLTLVMLDEPDDPAALLHEFDSVSYYYGGIRDDGVRWYWRERRAT
jgi:hypothetical protein